ncbi:MAG: ATP-dependent RecD-like DNA helicase, partial [bacterium]
MGSVERIRFRAEDTGYTVLLLKPDGDLPPVVAVGPLSSLREGERVRFEGEWKDHPRFGRQFQVASVHPLVLTTAEGIEKFLASGAVKRIGPVLAGRIVSRFGAQTLEIFENEPARLLEVQGLGPKMLADIEESWSSQREVKEVMLFLQQYEIPLHLAEKIFRAYGAGAIQVLREDPYRLATDIHGVGFRTADRIARQMGLPPDAPRRIEAGVLYLLSQQAETNGHVFMPRRALVEEAAAMLEADPELVDSAIEGGRGGGGLIVEDAIAGAAAGGAEESKEGDEGEGGGKGALSAVYNPALHAAETEVARRLISLLRSPRDEARLEAALRGKGLPGASLMERLGAYARKIIEGGQATADQERAIESALVEKVVIVTGGPGTGKTTVINAITRLYTQLGLQILLGAPTGRAAKRLAEVTRHGASTIHRLLEFSWASGGFTRDASNPLIADAVIIDEASMIDISLMAHLLRAVPDGASFVLVGDVDQLPSVGPGHVLRDLIESDALPIVRLREVFRQAKESLIVENAHRVNRGEMPREREALPGAPPLDYYFIEEADPERCADLIVEMCRDRIPRRFGLDPIDDVQVISPMQRGVLGVQSLNARLQEALNPAGSAPVMRTGGRTFRAGDKLIQVRNNYEKNVFNGDIGRVTRLDPEGGAMHVSFDGQSVEYASGGLDEVVLAYAVTIHKSQGSEYPAVVVPLHTQHYPMLQRNLIYTALTRARRLAVLVGTKKALGMAVKNAQVRRRWSQLAERVCRNAGLPAPPPHEEAAPASREADSEPSAARDERPPESVYDEETSGGEEEEAGARGE